MLLIAVMSMLAPVAPAGSIPLEPVGVLPRFSPLTSGFRPDPAGNRRWAGRGWSLAPVYLGLQARAGQDLDVGQDALFDGARLDVAPAARVDLDVRIRENAGL